MDNPVSNFHLRFMSFSFRFRDFFLPPKNVALDVHPPAIRSVQSIPLKRQMTDVETICSDCKTGLQDNRVDIVLLYDTLHTLSDPKCCIRRGTSSTKTNEFCRSVLVVP